MPPALGLLSLCKYFITGSRVVACPTLPASELLLLGCPSAVVMTELHSELVFVRLQLVLPKKF